MSLKNIVKKSIAEIYFNAYKKYQREVGNRIILYHSIGSKLTHDTYGISISKKDFSEHIKYLKQKYKIIAIDENYQNNLQENSVSITLDDGYKDNLYALELCEKYDIPFTLYISTGFIGQKQYLTEDEIQLFSKSNLCRLGTHSVTHPHLDTLSYDKQFNELNDSKNRLEDIVGYKITEMSYPHGSYNNNTIKIIDKLGYNLISSSHIGLNTIENIDLKRLKRIEIIGSDDLIQLEKKILGYYDFLSLKEKL
jgi:peptidoglycan/xylan/chitin deacetylase (PgdA/CDA1 family)